MRTLQRTVSLEQVTSRLPSIIPAYLDNVLYFFDNDSLKNREYMHTSNYGMVPMMIVLENAPSATTEYVLANGDTCSADTAFSISFERLSNMYYFFRKYYLLLNEYGHCNRVYSSATEYYFYESRTKYSNQMVFGNDENTYISIDKRFNAYGGKVDLDSIANGNAFDIGFYKWICERIIPTYQISNKYSSYWNRDKLFYPDVIRWMAWFSDRLDYESVYIKEDGDVETWDCKKYSGDCCDCDEYFNRGGKREFDRMREWYINTQPGIAEINNHIKENEKCFIPTIVLPMEIQTSIDDLGQFTIFSKDFESGTDYRCAHYGDSENTLPGTVVTVDGNPMILTSGQGFCFNRELMSMSYNEDNWDDYTTKYFVENPELCSSSLYNYYTFDENDSIRTSDKTTIGEAMDDLKDKLKEYYPATTSDYGWVMVENSLYEIKSSEFGIIKNKVSGKNDLYYVERDEHTNTPYTYMKGLKIYAELYQYGETPCFYFEIFKSDNYTGNPEDGTKKFNINDYKKFPLKKYLARPDELIKYVVYDGGLYRIEGTECLINSSWYPVIKAYAIYNDELMYTTGDSSVFLNDSDGLRYENENFEYDEDNNQFIVSVENDPIVYSSKEITGRTVSKIYSLRTTSLLVDDVGNTIECFTPIMAGTVYAHQPSEGSEMEPIYQIGNVANVKRMKITKTDVDDVGTGEKNYFVGDIIQKMVFYYKDVLGNIVENTISDAKDFDGSSLRAIQNANTAVVDPENEGVVFDTDVYCDITYNIGATLSRKLGERFKLAYLDDHRYNYGVEYTETVRFKKVNKEYYLKLQDDALPVRMSMPGNHSISYPISVYEMVQDLETAQSSTYGVEYSCALANFRCEINLMSVENGRVKTTFEEYNDMDAFNGVKVFPVFRQEYLLGVSSLENVNSDIYIERGINAAFEKHLKLGEVTSLETLENYGLGYFKFMDN